MWYVRRHPIVSALALILTAYLIMFVVVVLLNHTGPGP